MKKTKETEHSGIDDRTAESHGVKGMASENPGVKGKGATENHGVEGMAATENHGGDGHGTQGTRSRVPDYEEAVRFHGHSCPGLAIGFRMTLAGLRALGNPRSEDEELIAVTENSACGADALQWLSGCTFGKGNLFFLDYGKHSYTLGSRTSGRAVRVTSLLGKDTGPGAGLGRKERIEFILTAPEEVIVKVMETDFAFPAEAVIEKSVPCSTCGEATMESRLERRGDALICRGCLKK